MGDEGLLGFEPKPTCLINLQCRETAEKKFQGIKTLEEKKGLVKIKRKGRISASLGILKEDVAFAVWNRIPLIAISEC